MGEKETSSGRLAGARAEALDPDSDDDAMGDGSDERKAAPPRDKGASSQRATNLNSSRSNRVAAPGDDADPDDAAINNTKSNIKN